MEIPEWIKLTLDTTPLQDATDIHDFDSLRTFCKSSQRQLFKTDTSRICEIPSITKKFRLCCENNMIAFIQYNAKNRKYLITPNIIEDLRKKKLDGLVGNLEGLAHMMGFKCQSHRVMEQSCTQFLSMGPP